MLSPDGCAEGPQKASKGHAAEAPQGEYLLLFSFNLHFNWRLDAPRPSRFLVDKKKRQRRRFWHTCSDIFSTPCVKIMVPGGLRSGQVTTSKNVCDPVKATMAKRKLWNFHNVIHPLLPTVCISRIFYRWPLEVFSVWFWRHDFERFRFSLWCLAAELAGVRLDAPWHCTKVAPSTNTARAKYSWYNNVLQLML